MIEWAPIETITAMNWYDAEIFCQFLVVDGKNDWRMPELEEVKEKSKSDDRFSSIRYWTDDDIGARMDYVWIWYGLFNSTLDRVLVSKMRDDVLIWAVRDI